MFDKPLTDGQLKANKRLFEYLFTLDEPKYYTPEWEFQKRLLVGRDGGSVYDRAAHDFLLRKYMVLKIKGQTLTQPHTEALI